MNGEFDERVRIEVYRRTMDADAPPSIAEVAASLGVDRIEIEQSFRRLAEGRVLVLERKSGEILMAPPWSAVPTAFVVKTARGTTYGNCMWDALGVLAALHADGEIVTSCADCGESASVRVENEQVRGEGFVHFALRVRQWWNNVVFT